MTRRVVLVVGPPGAGKSTWVHAHTRPGDMVVDFDEIARDLGSRHAHRHDSGVIARAIAEQKRRERDVARMEDGTAFVIRVGSDRQERNLLATRLRADEVRVIDPGRAAVESRLSGRPESARLEVDRWYRLNG